MTAPARTSAADAARPAIAVFALAAAARLAYLAVAPPGHAGVYWDLSTSLLQHGTLTAGGVITTEYEPLYPIFLAAARWVTFDHVRLVQALQAIVAAAGAVVLAWLGEALTGRRRIGLIAAVLYAIDPLLVRHAADPTESTLVVVLLLVSTYAFVTARTASRSAVAGAAFGLLVVARAMTLPIMLLGVPLLVAERRAGRALALALTALVVASPFALRNYRLYGRLLPTRSGINLFVGNSVYASGLLPAYSPDILQPYADGLVASERPELAGGAPADQVAADDWLSRRAWEEMRGDPARTIWLKIRNVGYFFSPRLVPSRLLLPETSIRLEPAGRFVVENSPPRPIVDQVVYAASYGAELVLACAGVYLRRRQFRRDAILWIVLATFVGVYAVYFPATRYRVPATFVLLLYAAVALDAWIAKAGLTGDPDRRESRA